MKKFLLTIALMIALFVPWAHGQTDTITIFDGTATSNAFPFYIFYFDDFTKSNYIIPASALQDIVGAEITGMTFYVSQTGGSSPSTAQMYLKEVASSIVSNPVDVTTATKVFEGTLNTAQVGPLQIVFNQPFVYNGGNLLVATQNITDLGYKSVYYYGMNNAGSGAYKSDGNSLNNITSFTSNLSFIPKTTISFVASCPRPKNITVSNITDSSAKISWTQGNTETSWQYCIVEKGGSPDWDNSTTINTAFCTINGLDSHADYDFYVRSYCSETDQSFPYKASFQTMFSVSDKFTVCDGENQNSYSPFNIVNCDNYNKVNTIIPASELQLLAGMDLDSMAFYINSTSGNVGANVQIYLKEVSETAVSDPIDATTATKVYEGALNTSNTGSLAFAFTTPFHYNGGNLMIVTQTTAPGTLKDVAFEGRDGIGSYGTAYATGSLNNITLFSTTGSFAPKTTLYFTTPTYTVTTSSNNPTMGSVTGAGSYLFKTKVTLTATTTSDEYIFTGWSNGEDNDTLIIDLASDTNLVANFDYFVERTIRFNSCGGTDIESITAKYLPTVMPTPTYPTGATFGGWYFDMDYTRPVAAGQAIAKDMVLYAKWIQGTTTLNYGIFYGQNRMETGTHAAGKGSYILTEDGTGNATLTLNNADLDKQLIAFGENLTIIMNGDSNIVTTNSTSTTSFYGTNFGEGAIIATYGANLILDGTGKVTMNGNGYLNHAIDVRGYRNNRDATIAPGCLIINNGHFIIRGYPYPIFIGSSSEFDYSHIGYKGNENTLIINNGVFDVDASNSYFGVECIGGTANFNGGVFKTRAYDVSGYTGIAFAANKAYGGTPSVMLNNVSHMLVMGGDDEASATLLTVANNQMPSTKFLMITDQSALDVVTNCKISPEDPLTIEECIVPVGSQFTNNATFKLANSNNYNIPEELTFKLQNRTTNTIIDLALVKGTDYSYDTISGQVVIYASTLNAYNGSIIIIIAEGVFTPFIDNDIVTTSIQDEEYPWESFNDSTRTGISYRSTNYGIHSTNSISTFIFNPKEGVSAFDILFDYAVSCESGWDKMSIYVNDVAVVSNISGEVTNSYLAVCTDTTEIKVTYTKDNMMSAGDDRGYIYNIRVINPFTVTANANDTTIGSVTGAGTYHFGNEATLTATPNAHYHFVNWSNGSTQNPLTIIVDKDSALTATFAIDTHNIDATPNDETRGGVTGGGDYEYGATATLTATPNTHYHFLSWSNGSTQNPLTFVVDKDSALIATFAINTHNIDATPNDETMGDATGGGDYEYGATATLTATPNAHYHFVNWSNGSTQNPLTFTVDRDSALIATFAIDTHNIDATPNDETRGGVTGGGDYEYGATVTLTATSNAHYHFVNWSNGSTQNPLTFTVESDSTLTANFAIDTHNIATSVNNAAMGSTTGDGDYEYGATATLTATPNAHYHFVNWSNGSTQNPLSIIVDKDSTLTANFAIDMHNIVTNVNNEIMGSAAGDGEYEYGATATLTATPNVNYHFVNWSNGSTQNPLTFTVDRDSALTANFAIDTHNIATSVNNAAMGSTTGDGEYAYGTTVTLTATPNAHYHFVNWSNGSTQNPLSIIVDKDSALTANFAIDQHTVTVISDDVNLGSVTGSGVYDYGTPVAITATPAGYYVSFTGWSNGVMTPAATINLTGDTTVIGFFELNDYTISLNTNNDDMGSVSGAGVYTYGNVATITATPAYCHHFVNWSDGDTHATRAITVVNDLTLTANFAVDEYTISVSVNNTAAGKAYCNDSGAEAASMNVDCGTVVEIHAEAETYYHFVEWSDGSEDAIRNIDVTSDTDLVAIFEPNCGDGADLPVVFLYNDLLMLDLDSIKSRNYDPKPTDVTWYQVVDDVDMLEDVFPLDDKALCTGYYLSLPTNNVGYGQYYAVVNVGNSKGLCQGLMKTVVTEYVNTNSKPRVEMAPTSVKAGDYMTITGIAADEKTVITVCDYTGKTVETMQTEGAASYDLKACGVAGVYIVKVTSESVNETLRFVVTK